MKYSTINVSKWVWTYDSLGSDSYNVLGALECTLININLIDRVKDWTMDEMERYSYKFSNQLNYFTQSEVPGFLLPSDKRFEK